MQDCCVLIRRTASALMTARPHAIYFVSLGSFCASDFWVGRRRCFRAAAAGIGARHPGVPHPRHLERCNRMPATAA